MFTSPLIAELSPVFLSSLAIFITVTLVMWVILEKISGGDRPNAEIRLQRLQNKKQHRDLAELAKENANAKATLTNVLEKAASPLADTVSGNEEEMS